ncbi:ABC transporter ATP-binding protein [Paenibacillus kobensis]|uniref:ABC transporter ATP-binding protein n=1 Tax=Paenibacillus kobensis TaxID=59841 RepID=UPI0013E40E8D|nr:ABC transporter ATP-binding protein [Paenibacillus kobensis]
MSAVVRLENVSKVYENIEVLKRINLSIGKRQVVGVVGPNGSGKSTLLKITAGLIRPTGGGIHTEAGGAKAAVGYVPERFPQLRLTPREYLLSMGRFQRIERARLEARIAELLEWFGMTGAERRRMNDFSKGMLQKVNLMQAVLNEPDLLVMDEPLSGLDTAAQHELVRLLGGLKEQGMAMLLSCHEELLLERLADRVVALRAGELGERHSSIIKEADVVITCRFQSPDRVLQLEKKCADLLLQSTGGGLHLIQVEVWRVDDVLRHILELDGSVVSVIPGTHGVRAVEGGMAGV